MFAAVSKFLYSETTSFPYKQQNQIFSYDSPLWKLYNGINATNESPVSIFLFDKTKFGNDSDSTKCARNALQKLKTLRHPHVLLYKDSTETQTQILIATERIQPFKHTDEIKNNNLLSLTLFQLTSAISFLNNDCKLIHSNLHPSSLFITESGEWKLFGFELTYIAGEIPDYIIQMRNQLLPSHYRSPELVKFGNNSQSFNSIECDQSVIYYIDSWCLGCLMYDVFSSGSFSSPQHLSQKHILPPELQNEYKSLLSTNPQKRLNPKHLLECSFFQTDVVKTVAFLDELAIKSSDAKETFFSNFQTQLNRFPPSIARGRILPQLIQALTHQATSNVFPSILKSVLTIGNQLEDSQYKQIVLPAVISLFKNNERSVRIHLLTCLNEFSSQLSSDLLNSTIYPSIAIGFSDSVPLLRELTVKSLPLLIDRLNDANVSDALKRLSKTQTDPEPAIRTNTIYCIAKCANHLKKEVKERVLIPAFLRSLADPFPPAKIAALVSFTVTVNHYAPAELSRKVLPLVVRLMSDDVAEVREKAIKCVYACTQSIETWSLKNGDLNTVVSDGKSMNSISTDYASLASSVTSWALTSLTSKFVSGTIAQSEKVISSSLSNNSLSTQNELQQHSRNNSNLSAKSNKVTQHSSSTASSQTCGGWEDFDSFIADDDIVSVTSLSTKVEKTKNKETSPAVKPKIVSAPLSDDENNSDSSDGFTSSLSTNKTKTKPSSTAKTDNLLDIDSVSNDWAIDLSLDPLSNSQPKPSANKITRTGSKSVIQTNSISTLNKNKTKTIVTETLSTALLSVKKPAPSLDDWDSFLND